MSIILKGIDMPPTVNGVKLTHELYIRSDGRVFDDEFEEVGQAIQIPKGHGRLGDLDELASKCDEPNWCVWLNEIDDAPTILEAEE